MLQWHKMDRLHHGSILWIVLQLLKGRKELDRFARHIYHGIGLSPEHGASLFGGWELNVLGGLDVEHAQQIIRREPVAASFSADHDPLTVEIRKASYFLASQ